MAELESILESVRKTLGPTSEYTYFDSDLIMHINTYFLSLYRLGVGADPTKPFSITGPGETWNDFTGGDPKWNAVKTYMCMKVRLAFDPPQSSFVLNSMKEEADRIEWELRMVAETPALGGKAPSFDYDNYKFDNSTGRWVDGDE